MMAISRQLLWGSAVSLFLLVPACMAQTSTGTITGEVTDPSGAVIAGAAVTAHALDTDVDTHSTSNAQGVFRIDFLPVGKYEVSVAAAGFETAKLPPFSLEVLQTANFNVHLIVGRTSTSVTVSAASPILDTDDPTISSIFTANTISNFPLNGQDFSALTLYLPGAVDTAGTSGTTSFERST
jgi:hypothetical protein